MVSCIKVVNGFIVFHRRNTQKFANGIAKLRTEPFYYYQEIIIELNGNSSTVKQESLYFG